MHHDAKEISKEAGYSVSINPLCQCQGTNEILLQVVDFGNRDDRSSVADWPLQLCGRHIEIGDVLFYQCVEKNVSTVKGEAPHED